MNTLTIKDAINNKSLNKLVDKIITDKNQALKLVGNIASVVITNPGLSKCTAQSIVGASIIAQSLNLSLQPQMGRCWMVPYANKYTGSTNAQFQLGYLGYVELATRTGLYDKIGVKEIYENELGEFDEFGDMKFNWQREKKGDIVGYYAYFVMKNGFKKDMFMSKQEMQDFAHKYSKSYGNGTSTDCWTTMFDDMSKKTILKKLIRRWGVLNENESIAKAIATDGGVVDENGNVEYVDNPQPQETLKLEEVE